LNTCWTELLLQPGILYKLRQQHMKWRPHRTKKLLLQKDVADCGVVCLQNILRDYQVELSLEKLREMSGTDARGTTLLGLYQAAEELGFRAVGAEAEGIGQLQEVKHPAILHLTLNNSSYHYVIYYPPMGNDKAAAGRQFTIGDPAVGIETWTEARLEENWRSKTILLLEPTEKLLQQSTARRSKIKWFRDIISKDLDLLCMAAFFGLIMAVLNLSTAIFSQKLIDQILPQHQTQKLLLGIILLLLLLLTRSGLSRLRNYLLIKQSCRFNTRITAGFFESLLYLPKPFFDNRKTGDLTSRLNDINRIQQAVSYIVGDVSVQALFLIMSVSFIFFYHVQIGLFCLLVIPLQFLVVKYFERRINENYKATMSANAAKESSYIDAIRGIGTIKALGREALFIGRGKAVVEWYQRALYRLGDSRTRFLFSSEVVTTFFLLIIIGWSAALVLRGELRAGELIALLQMTSSMVQTVTTLSLTNLQLQEARVAFDRLYEFASIEPEFRPAPLAPAAPGGDGSFCFDNLRVSDISFRFRGRKTLLHNISFTAAVGEIVVITGESGQGKSTLFQLLQRMYVHESGEIRANGQLLSEIDLQQWRRTLGIVPQDISIFGGTLPENIALDSDSEKLSEVPEFCRRYGFDAYFTNFPQGYHTVLGEAGIALSGGQKQLLALARCLYHRPRLLLLDEPTASMDADTERFVIGLLQQIRTTTAIVMISHRNSLVEIANRVYRLEKGTLINDLSYASTLSVL